jgi:hypothetical protein
MTVAVSRDITRGLTTLDSIRVRLPKRGTAARKTTGRFVCIPYHSSSKLIASSNSSAIHVTPSAQWDTPESYNTPHVYPVLAGERVYDLGWRENWRRLLRQPLFDNDIQHHGRVLPKRCALTLSLRTHSIYKWPKMNPSTIRRMLSSESMTK